MDDEAGIRDLLAKTLALAEYDVDGMPDGMAALERMRALLRPGGTIAVVGLGRSRYPADLAFDTAGAVATRVHKLSKTYWETSAPKIWPPPETYAEVRQIAARVLPGARYRRHAMWRYSLVWTKSR